MTPDEYIQEEMAKWKAMWDGGHPFALYGAVQACAVGGFPLPEWLGIAVLNLIADYHANPPPKAPKGGSRYTKKARDDLEHWRRWNAVQWLRRRRVPWEEVYDLAAIQLYGRVNAKGGTPSAVKASYLLVQRARETKDPTYSFSTINPGQMPG